MRALAVLAIVALGVAVALVPVTHAHGVSSAARTAAGRPTAPLHAARANTAGPCGPAWKQVSTPNTGTGAAFAWVAAAGPTDVWGLGAYTNSAGLFRTLGEHWDGSKWSAVSLPDPTNGSDYINGGVALAPTDAYAVGSSATGGLHAVLVLHWDGSSWQSVSGVPNPSSTQDSLAAVTATDPTSLWAVGEYDATSPAQTIPLVLHWDGTGWTQAQTPSTGTGSSRFYAVSGSSSDDVWAVGSYSNAAPLAGLIEHWDGTLWTVIPNPANGSTNSMLAGVAAIAPADAWAVGQTDVAGAMQPLVLHWDGYSWSDIRVAAPTGANSARLLGIHATTSRDVWAAGTAFDGTANLPLLAHWDGSNWQTVVPPPGAGDDEELTDVTQTPAGDLWAVGSRSGHTIAYRLCPNVVGDSGFSEPTSTVPLGSTVVWSVDPAATQSHSVTDASSLGLFDSGSLPPGGSYLRELDVASAFTITDTSTGQTSVLKVTPVASPTSGSVSTPFTLSWAQAAPPGSDVFDVQVKPPGSTAFKNWLHTTSLSGTFTPNAGTGSYAFRARLRDPGTGAALGWSPSVTITAQ